MPSRRNDALQSFLAEAARLGFTKKDLRWIAEAVRSADPAQFILSRYEAARQRCLFLAIGWSTFAAGGLVSDATTIAGLQGNISKPSEVAALGGVAVLALAFAAMAISWFREGETIQMKSIAAARAVDLACPRPRRR